MIKSFASALVRSVPVQNQLRAMSSVPATMNYETLAVSTPKPFVFHVELNRPKNLNALNGKLWKELGECFQAMNDHSECRVVILSGGSSKHFSAGIDLKDMMSMGQDLSEMEDVARKGVYLRKKIKAYQDSISSIEWCVKPVIGLSHNACIGAGINLFSTVDVRYCTNDAFFQVKEVDIGMAADVGALQRFPKAIGSQSLARELCFTARRFEAAEALSCGFVSRVFDSKDAMLEAGLILAEDIASKSPVAVQCTKQNLIYSQSHTNQEGLDQIRELNAMRLQSEDFINAVMAQATKGEKPVFAKL